MASALGSLLANYTDSEGEEDHHDDDIIDRQSDDDSKLHPSLADRLGKLGKESHSSPGGSSGSRQSNSVGGTPTKKAKLVSYIDPDAGLSDDERDSVPMDLESDDEDKENGGDGVNDKELDENEEIDEKERSHCMEELWDGGIKLPPEPRGECSRELQDKFENLCRKKVDYGYDYNKIIQQKKAFRNPSIYEKLILFCDIDEFGTNFPPELYDGHLFGKESYYEELAKSQKEEMDKREKLLEARKKSGDNRLKEGHNVVSRKSKWDQQGPGAGAGPGKVIPAFGALKRK